MKQTGNTISLVQVAPGPDSAPLSDQRYAEDLAVLLNEDEALGRSLGRAKHSPKETAHTVLSHARMWCDKNAAVFFAVVLDQATAIGTISLSHLDPQKRSARTGYWIGTRFQGLGYGKVAFHCLITFAQSLGVRSISGRIAVDNHASRRIWEQHEAEIVQEGGCLKASLVIGPE